MATRTDFELDFAPKAQPVYSKTREGKMRVVVMADLTGRSNRGVVERGDALAERPLVPVDVDVLDDVLFRYAPKLDLALGRTGEASTALELKRFEDFHPDELYARLDLFQAFRGMRERMQDPATFEHEAEALRVLDDHPQHDQGKESDSDTLERLLGQKPSAAPRSRPKPTGPAVDIGEFVKRLVQPHVVAQPSAQQEHLVRSVDDATGEQMRAVLHDPAFQGLEATWRAIRWLVTSLETGEDLKLFLLDVSREELAADLARARHDLPSSGLYRLLVERSVRTAGGEPWSLLVGDYRFGPSAEDLMLLGGLGAVASHAGGPFLAEADPALLGCGSLDREADARDWSPLDADAAARWQALRKSSVAPWIGLALPRVLMRLPYGPKTDPVEAFAFEELPDPMDHDAFLWGNPAFLCTILIASAFLERGWEMAPGDLLELGDLPAFTFEAEGETRLKPCAEVLLNERTAEAILKRGPMPLLSYSNRDAVRMMRFQSVADPPAPLKGPWG